MPVQRPVVPQLPGRQAQLAPLPARSARLPVRPEPLLVQPLELLQGQLPLVLRPVQPGHLGHPERLARPEWCCPA